MEPVADQALLPSRTAASGLARVALSSVLFGLLGVLIRLAHDHGAGVATVLAVRSFALLPWLAAFASRARRARVREAWRQLVAMALLQTANAVTFYVAVTRMSPALVALIFYAYPALVVVGSHLLGWSRLDALIGVAVSATLLGVGLTIGLPDSGIDALGVVLAVVNGAGYAVYILCAHAALRRVDPVTTIAFVVGLSSILLLSASFVLGVSAPSSEAETWSLLALAAAILFPHVLLMGGIGRLGSAWASLVTSLEVVTTVVATALLLHQHLGPGSIAGGALIVLGGVAAPIVASRRSRPAGTARSA